VICSDGIFEAMNEEGEEFTAARLMTVVERRREDSAKGIVDAIFDAVERFRGDAIQNDDMTAVAIKITA
jgi:sigma-B regulation protein RsbU (phosphoserine phosphatase)